MINDSKFIDSRIFREITILLASLLVVACGGGTNDTEFSAPNSQMVSLAPAVSSLGLSSGSFSSASLPAASSSSSSVVEMGSVEIYWAPPNQRVNGDPLDIAEIGGYELRYRRKSEDRYTHIIINDNYANFYYLSSLQGEYEFQIAVFDAEGLYSAFVEVKRM